MIAREPATRSEPMRMPGTVLAPQRNGPTSSWLIGIRSTRS